MLKVYFCDHAEPLAARLERKHQRAAAQYFLKTDLSVILNPNSMKLRSD